MTRETVAVAHLDEDAAVIDIVTVAEGDAAVVALPVPAILRGAIGRGAGGILLAHNHPSGDATPSLADVRATRDLLAGAGAIGLRLVDHVVVARGGASSFRMMGLM